MNNNCSYTKKHKAHTVGCTTLVVGVNLQTSWVLLPRSTQSSTLLGTVK